MKVLRISIGVVVSVLVLFTVFFTSMELLIYNMNYYEWHYTTRNIMEDTKMELNELMEATDKMLDYLKDDRETLDMAATIDGEVREVFNEREKLHMIDVKDLFVFSTQLRNYSFIILLLVIPFMLWKYKNLLIMTLSSIKYVFTGIISLILIIGTLLLIDFNKYFTIFHLIFFNNDLWILNPDTDILINMVPEVFFFTTAMIILGIFVIMSLILIFIGEKLKKKLIAG